MKQYIYDDGQHYILSELLAMENLGVTLSVKDTKRVADYETVVLRPITDRLIAEGKVVAKERPTIENDEGL